MSEAERLIRHVLFWTLEHQWNQDIKDWHDHVCSDPACVLRTTGIKYSLSNKTNESDQSGEKK